MRSKKITILLISLLIMIVSTKFLYSHYAEKNLYKEVEGEILIALTDNKAKDGVYIASLDQQSEMRQFYSHYYELYDFPFMQDNNFFCVGYKEEFTESTLLMVEGGLPSKKETTVLMKVKGNIKFPVITKDLNLIYYIKGLREPKKGYKNSLCRYDRSTQKEYVLVEGGVDENSKILLCIDGSVIYVREEPHIPNSTDKSRVKYSIHQLFPSGETKILVENSKSQVWLEEDKSILFSGKNKETGVFKDIYRYDLETQENTFICNQYWRYSPTISPDKKHLIFSINTQYGGLYYYLASVDGKKAKEIQQLRSSNSQPFWWK